LAKANKKSRQLSFITQKGAEKDKKVTAARIVLGFNGKKHYGGLSFTSYYFSENLFQDKYTYWDYTYSFLRVFVGIRLKPGFRIPLLDR